MQEINEMFESRVYETVENTRTFAYDFVDSYHDRMLEKFQPASLVLDMEEKKKQLKGLIETESKRWP